jgi:hypothetical protein
VATIDRAPQHASKYFFRRPAARATIRYSIISLFAHGNGDDKRLPGIARGGKIRLGSVRGDK